MTDQMIVESFVNNLIAEMAHTSGMSPDDLSHSTETTTLPNGDIRVQVEIWDDSGQYSGPKRVERTLRQLNG